MRGILIHDVMEKFISRIGEDQSALSAPVLMQIAEQVLVENMPWPAARTLWLARLGRVADWFVEQGTDPANGRYTRCV